MRGPVLRRFLFIPCLLATAPATLAQSLAIAIDACESFVATGTIPDTVDTEFTLFGDFDYAAVETEVGRVLLTFALDYGMNSTTYCDLTGADPRDESAPISVTWSKALPLIDSWYSQRVAKGGGKSLPVFGAQRMFAACSDAGEYFISAQPYSVGKQTANLPEDDWPFVISVNEWSGNAARPCDV